MLAPLAERVVERIVGRLSEQYSSASTLTLAETRSALRILMQAIESSGEPGVVHDFAQYSWTTHAPRLLVALRRDLLAGHDCSIHGSDSLVRMLSAIDIVEQSLDQEVASRFVHELSGSGSLPLLVEVVHDMRSPLTAILFLIERLQQGQSGPVSAAQQRHLALVYSAAFGLDRLTSDLMELANGGQRLLDETPKRFSVSEVLRTVRNLVQPVAEEKKLSLRFSGPAVDKRFGQPAALSRVLLNLATNSLKFTTIGSVTLLVEQQPDGDELLFVVEDTGCGIVQPDSGDIFSTFVVRDTEGAKKFSSSGLGLAICQKLVAAMGGTLRVQSQVDSGTRVQFRLRLPPA